MINKLKCPFCGAELTGREDAYGNISDVWLECPNDDGCEHAYNALRFDVWQALIDGKKAQDALDNVDTMLFSLILKAHDLTALDLLQGITDIRLKIIKFITKQEKE